MATTKQLLERMVQKVCGLADCVSGNPVTIPAPTSTYQEYVPTKDGYIFLHTTPSADGYYYALRPNTSTAYACIFTSMTLGAGTFSSNTFRVWKGKVCRYKQTDPNPSLSEAIFFESIGGGGV